MIRTWTLLLVLSPTLALSPAMPSNKPEALDGSRQASAGSLAALPVWRYATYLGGRGADFGGGIAVDSRGNAYVVGGTTSDNFPTLHAWQARRRGNEAFVTKFSRSGHLVYSTYLGGSGSQYANAVAVDRQGNVYLTGLNNSPDFPTPHGHLTNPEPCPEAFLAQLNPKGKLVFSTGMQLSSDIGGYCFTEGTGIAVDGRSNAFVVGSTQRAGHLESFVERFNLKTHKGYVARIPGTTGAAIAVDNLGNAYVTGAAAGRGFTPVHAFQSAFGGGLQDAFVAKLDTRGAIVFSTYLGGSGDETGRGIAVDRTGSIYLTGDTSSVSFPRLGGLPTSHVGGVCRPGEQESRCTDAFVTKLSSDGQTLVYSTYLAGSDDDGGNAIALDRSGNAYITGYTSSSDFPTVQAPQAASGGGLCAYSTTKPFPCNDAFVAKLNTSGSKLLYSTYLGGPDEDAGASIAVDGQGNALVTGFTRSRRFPTVKAAQPAYRGGTNDAFVGLIGKR